MIGVLSLASHDNSVDRCMVTLTTESLDAVKSTKGVETWWPKFEDADPTTGKSLKTNVKHQGLFVSRQGRKKHARAKAKAQADASTEARPKKRGRPKKAKKPRKTRLTKARKTMLLPETLENLVRNPRGDKMIRQLMEKCRRLDLSLHPERKLFDDNNRCCLKLGQCRGLPWGQFLDKAFAYFRTTSPDLYCCGSLASQTLSRWTWGYLGFTIL